MTEINPNTKAYYSETFKNTKYTSLVFHNIEFEECTFNECDMSEVLFTECKFINCLFLKCNLSVTQWKKSKLADVIFDECKLVGINWTEVNWSSLVAESPVKFYKCILNDASFFGLSLEAVVMQNCKAINVDFREGSFMNADFSETDFAESLFNETNLTGADFSEAINYRIDIYYNEIKRAKFSRIDAISLLEGLDIELI